MLPSELVSIPSRDIRAGMSTHKAELTALLPVSREHGGPSAGREWDGMGVVCGHDVHLGLASRAAKSGAAAPNRCESVAVIRHASDSEQLIIAHAAAPDTHRENIWISGGM